MAQGNEFVDNVLSDKSSLIHLLDSNDAEDNKEAHILKHSPYYGETDFSKLLVEKTGLTLYDPGGGGGGLLKPPLPLIFCSHAFNFRAVLLCVGDFSQKNSLTPCGEKIFLDGGS